MPGPIFNSLPPQRQPGLQRPLSLRGLAAIGLPTTPLDPASSGIPPRRGGDVERLMQQAAGLLAAGGRGQDAAVAVYFQAIDASTTYEQAVAVATALPNRLAYRDVTFAALGECITRASTREQALSAAELAWSKGHSFDRWGGGALERALLYSTTPAEASEIASLAHQHDYLERYRGIEQRAAAKAAGA
jgi:hypothetical protein